MSELASLPPARERVVTEREVARDRLGASVRALVDSVVRSAGSTAELSRAADGVNALVALLDESAAPRRPHDSPFHPLSLVGGVAHPVAPQIAFAQIANGVTGTVRLGPVFEGGPTLAHGGVVALIFDHAMGAAVYLAGHAAMTRTLTVTYTAPTPLDVDLRVHAEVAKVDGRQVHVVASISARHASAEPSPPGDAGESSHAEMVTARAEAVFTVLTEDNLARIFSAQR